MKLRCLLIDDEPLSVRVLEKYARELPALEVVASCADAFEAMEVLQREKIDLLFLDINMPKLSGISLVKSLRNDEEISCSIWVGCFGLGFYFKSRRLSG